MDNRWLSLRHVPTLRLNPDTVQTLLAPVTNIGVASQRPNGGDYFYFNPNVLTMYTVRFYTVRVIFMITV